MTVRREPPGPRLERNPLKQIQLAMQFRRDPLGAFLGMRERFGDVFSLQFGKGLNYVLTHPDDMYEVLVTKAGSFHKHPDLKSGRTGLGRFIGNGLLTSDGEFWKRQRQLASPALHTRRVAAYAATMVELTLGMLRRWSGGAALSISREMNMLTMRIVAKTLLGSDVSEAIESVGRAMIEVQGVAGPPPMMPPWLPTPRELRRRQARRILDDVVYGFIREWRAKSEDRGDLLSMLLLARDGDEHGMTDEEARDELVTFFLAGHETVANALNWTWFLLAQNPEAEARLHDEIDSILGDRPPAFTDLEHLPYTEMILKESMRLYPPAWIVSRQAMEAVQVGEYVMPEGTAVHLVIYAAHHDARWWPQPEAFVPERFSRAEGAHLNKHAYMPFGAGPRVCVGKPFALMEGRLLIATIAQRYFLRPRPGDDVEKDALITLRPRGGLHMTVHPRVRSAARANSA